MPNCNESQTHLTMTLACHASASCFNCGPKNDDSTNAPDFQLFGRAACGEFWARSAYADKARRYLDVLKLAQRTR